MLLILPLLKIIAVVYYLLSTEYCYDVLGTLLSIANAFFSFNPHSKPLGYRYYL